MKMTDLSSNIDNTLSNYPLCLRKHIEELCLGTKIGLSSVKLADITVHAGNQATGDNLDNYHFQIKIPYAGKSLKWDVIFDPEDFYFTPDFDFNDDDFLPDPDFRMIANCVPSLRDWNLRNPKSLAQVLNEFLVLYKKIQIEKLQAENIYSRYCEEFQVLTTEENGVNQEDIEIFVEPTNVVFLISLKVDCSALPEFIQPLFSDYPDWQNPGEDFAILKISILKLDGSRANTSLQVSPRLEQIIGRNIYLPDYKKHIPLVEYVAKVSNVLENRVALVADHFRMKKVFVTNLAAICNQYIVEYDTDTFNKVIFMHKVNDYSCLVTVTFGVKFPHEKPIVNLSSVFCQESRACHESLENYAYGINATFEENVSKLLESLDEAVIKFKNHKHNRTTNTLE